MDDWISPASRTTDELAAFDAMRCFLEAYWERGGRRSDDIAVLLSSLNRNVATRSPPLDVAMWSDWRDALTSVIDATGW